MDIQKLRSETPGCLRKAHFNNAGAALMPEPVVQAMRDHLDLELLQGGYEAADHASGEIRGFHQSVARLVGTRPENIAFTSSATNAYARALSCIPFKAGDTVLIANEDYVSNQLAFLAMVERFGIKLLRAPSAPEGGVDVAALETLARTHRPVLVSLTHVPTNTGLVQPVEAVGKICRDLDIPYLVDACQSIGQFPVDVEAIGCDFLSATFRKFLRGPRGAGFLYVSDRILQKGWYPLYIDLRGATWTGADNFTVREDAIRFEDWELPYALVMGSKVATTYAMEVGLEAIAARNRELTELIRNRLPEAGWQDHDKGKMTSAIISATRPMEEPRQAVKILRDKDINTAIAFRQNAVIDFDAKGLNWILRISQHYYNTESEVDRLIEALAEIS